MESVKVIRLAEDKDFLELELRVLNRLSYKSLIELFINYKLRNFTLEEMIYDCEKRLVPCIVQRALLIQELMTFYHYLFGKRHKGLDQVSDRYSIVRNHVVWWE